MTEEKIVRIAVDIGGTFVDAIKLDTETGQFELRKSATTPREPWVGVLHAIEGLDSSLLQVDTFIHGTTLGLNSLLERRGAKTGIITNEGFRDIFLIGRANVPDAHMYDFLYARPNPLVARRCIMGVKGRRDYMGRVEQVLDEDDVRRSIRRLVEERGIEAIAICFLYSYVDPSDERRVAEIAKEMYPNVVVSISSNIAREHREFERTSTTVLDAYIRPVFERYMNRLEDKLQTDGFAGRFLVMRSGGGAMTGSAARRSPTHTVLSGPAGGIAGAEYLAGLLDRDDLISFDVGGTSLDVCKIEGLRAAAAFEAKLEDHPLLIPVYDIRSIGAGGGSIAWIDEGLLKVGPRSAGSEPGPICYGRGGSEPTVTDGAVCLGYIDPNWFLDGGMTLNAAGAHAGIEEKLADPLGIPVVRAASGLFDVLLAKTVGAVRQITVERGRDPATASLLGFGGAGPMLAPLVAKELGVSEVIIPVAPSGFSAWGMLNTDVVDDYARTIISLLDETPATQLEVVFEELESEALASLLEQGVSRDRATLIRQLELRYLGQEHALSISVGKPIDYKSIQELFAQEHEKRYGHTMDSPIQVLNLRIRGIGAFDRPQLAEISDSSGGPESAEMGKRIAFCFTQRDMIPFVVYDRAKFGKGDSLSGPALIDEGTSVTVIHSKQKLTVDRYGNLLILTGV
jgi:N-methylhydantoinase A